MYSIDSHGNKYYVALDDSDRSSVDINYQPQLALVVVTDSIDVSICNLTSDNAVASSASSSNLLPQDLYNWYGYISSIDLASEVCGDNFLQEYAINCGYQLTNDFLSVMNKHKINFIGKIDSVLIGLYGIVYSFLKDLEGNNRDVHLIKRTCSSFSRYAYDLRYNCIDFLRSDIIPAVIKSIFNSKIIDDNSERKMTYPEMEQLFLHFVSTLEKLIMVKMMKYWNDFCLNKKKYLSSLSSDVDYSNPFVCAYNFDKVIPVGITSPAAFTHKFGEYISFMAVDKINEMMSYFIGRCSYKFKEVIGSKYSYACNCIDRAYDDHDRLGCEFKSLMKEEFNKIIEKEVVKDRFSSFLSNVVIWNERYGTETNRVLISDKIVEHIRNFIEHMRNLLVSNATRDAHRIIDSFHEKLSISKRRLLVFGKCFPAIEARWGVKIHPEDDSKIISIKRKFVTKSRIIIKNKFRSLMKEGHKFLDGSVDWYKVSERLFPIAQDIIRHLVDAEYEEISRFLYSVRVVEDIDIFDGYSVGVRKAISEERDSILKIYTNHVYRRNRELSNRIWKELTGDRKNNRSKDVDFYSKLDESEKHVVSTVDLTRPVDGDYLADTSSVHSDSPIVTSMSLELGKRDKVINMWGLNLHPDDDKLIFFIRRKFSVQIVDNIAKLFCGMLKNKTVLPSGRVLCYSSWLFVSAELSEIATESIESITKKQYEELDRALSRARIVDFNEGDSSSCTIRKVTVDEKKELMIRARKIVDRSINSSIRSSWFRIVNDCSEYIHVSGRVGNWGVNIRHSDDIAILKTKRRLFSKIKDVLYDKFSSMIMDKHKFDDGTSMDVCAWFRLSRKLFPIAKEEAKHILEDGSRELEVIISRARVVVDLGVDRELTVEEKSIILKKVMTVTHCSLKKLSKRTWDRVVSSLGLNSVVTLSSDNLPDTAKVYSSDKSDGLVVKLCYEDDIAISNLRREFSHEINRRIGDKCSEIIKNEYRFDSDSNIGTYLWRNISKKLLPIIKKEIDPIVENERVRINDILLKSRAYVSLSDGHSTTKITRGFTSKERSALLETIMESIDKQLSRNFARIWNKIIRFPSVSLRDFSEEFKLEFDNIRMEFIGNVGTVLNETVDSLSSCIDVSSLPNLEDIISDIYDAVSEKSRSLFNEEGFLERVELLLSGARVVDSSGNDRLVTDEERKCVLKEFMDSISYDRDCLIEKRTSKLKNLFLPVVNS